MSTTTVEAMSERVRHRIRPDELMDAADIAALLEIAPRSFHRMRSVPGQYRKLDGLPEPIRYAGQAPVWDAREIRDWWESKNT